VTATGDVAYRLNAAAAAELDSRVGVSVSLWLARIVALIGVVVLIGWTTGSELLTTAIPDAIPMLPWTAVAFALGGGALWIYHTTAYRSGVAVMAFALLAIGAVMAVQRFAGLDLQVNQLLFPRTLALYPFRPVGLMASNSTVCMVMLGASLLILVTRRADYTREFFATVPLLIAFIAVLGHAYGASSLYSLDKFSGMAPITTVAFVCLAAAILLARPRSGAVSLAIGNAGSAVLTRRLLTATVVLPVVFGAVWLSARRAEIVSRELGVSLFVVVTVVAFVAMVFWSAGALRRSEAVRELARSEAENASRAKSDFLAVMSHELRTPLNAIRGYADLLEMEIDGPLTGLQKEHVLRIRKSEGHLLALIDDLLNYTQIESGRISLNICDLRLKSVIDEALLLTEPRARAKGVEIVSGYDGAMSEAVRADPEKLLQILLNLISNAIKFSDRGGRVSVRCTWVNDPAAQMITLEVRDSGKGIPADKIDSIFDPFFQVDRTLTRSTDGVGLGLAISRTLARAMSCEITATSTAGAGSSFVVSVPRVSEIPRRSSEFA
jgi:signal transduction histidine kinase